MNNQPVVKDGAIGIHNGIIVNDEKLWKQFPELKQNYSVDTEVFLCLLQMFRAKDKSLVAAVRQVFKQIEGSASVAVQFDDSNALVLATNTGSLYMSSSDKAIVFASEKYILEKILNEGVLKDLVSETSITQVRASQGYLIDIASLTKSMFSLDSCLVDCRESEYSFSKLNIVELYYKQEVQPINQKQYALREDIKQSMIENWEALYSEAIVLKRCKRCLLPKTMPYIEFDEEGICNYCRDYETRGSYRKGKKELENIVSKYRSADGKPDVLIGFSGGRDSAFGLDYMKNTLGLHPTTFTYDWGMVNDLARRNQARVVSKLGIEHILSQQTFTKRDKIFKRILKAWLKKPDLGMVPILMAGDKQFYYYFHKVRKQTGIKLFIFCGGYEGEEGTGSVQVWLL